MSLKEKIHKDMLSAVKAKESEKVDILKMALASIKNAEIEKGKELSLENEEEVLRKEEKKLKDAIEEYEVAGRKDLVEKEKKQLEVLEQYLPKLMQEGEVREVVEKKIAEIGAQGPSDMGKIMGAVMQELKGKADGTLVNNVVKEVLNEI